MSTQVNLDLPSGCTVNGAVRPGFETILTREALEFVVELTRKFGPRVEELLARRLERQKEIDAGRLPDFLPQTHGIREREWHVTWIPADLQDRRVEITGPTDRKMIINALNSGARVFMAYCEDSMTPTWDNVVQGQINLRDAAERRIEFTSPGGLRRWMIPVPLLTPYLSSLWLGLVTPLYARVGRKLVESLRNPTLVSNDLALRTFSVRPRSVREALARALVNEHREFAETRWSDALSAGGGPRIWGGVRFGSRLVDSRTAAVDVPPDQAFAPIRRIGGRTGWYYGDWLWSLRGFLDLLCGGVGVPRGRRDPEDLRVRRCTGLLASGTLRTATPPAIVRRNEVAGPCLAGVRGNRKRTTQYDPSDGHLRMSKTALLFSWWRTGG